jgi:hypothetical protein
MGRLPEPRRSIVGGLQTEDPLVPERIMGEANILNLEFLLPRLPFLRPGQMGFIELLAKFGNFDLVGNRKNNSRHGDPASCQIIANRDCVKLPLGDCRGKTGCSPFSAMLKAFLPLERWEARR